MRRGATPKRRLLTTVLFTDIVASTERAEELGDKRWRQLLTTHHRIVRRALKRHGGREIDTAGDGFFATFDQPSDAIDCANQLIDELHRSGIDIRAGVHMGEVEVIGDKVGGIAVHIGARVMSKASIGQVLVSSTVRDLMSGSDIEFDDAGFHELKGVSANLQLFAVRHDQRVEEARAPETAAPSEEEGARRRRVGFAAGAAALVALVAVLAIFLSKSGGGGFTVAPNTVVELDPKTGAVIGGVHVGTTPTGLAYSDGSLWVANFDDKTIQRIDVANHTTGSALGGILGNPTGIAVGGGEVWVTNGFAGQIVKINPNQANAVVQIPAGSGVNGVAYGGDALWVADANGGTLLRLDTVTNGRETVTLPEGSEPEDVAVGGGAVWVTDAANHRVIRVDPDTLKTTSIPLLEGEPARVAFGDGFVWVTSTDADSVTRIDPATNQASTIAHVGDGPVGVAAGPSGVWVANSLDGTVVHIDPSIAKVVARTRLGFSPDAVAVTPDGVWVSVHTA